MNSKGITIVSLTVTVIVLLILGGITISAGGNILKKTNLQTINTNMMLIQAKVKTISEQAKFNKESSNYIGKLVSEIPDNQKINKLINDGIITDSTKEYLISKDDLKQMGLTKIDIEDGYIVNYDTEEIIYVKGFETENTTYYKLSETKDLTIK